ncbi:MAG: hypothetical protein JNL06_04490 [Alphaproteobacteria bacterium]|nr:hypothetical protein [Alphaproteobacteria bacterium]
MLKTIARVVLALQGAAALFIAVNVWLDPLTIPAQLGLSPLGDLGLSTIRGDIGALFGGSGLFMLAAAYRAESRFVVPPLVFLSLALAARTYSLAMTGASPELFEPMAVEGVTIVLLLAAYAIFTREA